MRISNLIPLVFTLALGHAVAADSSPEREGLGRSFQHLKKTGALTIGYFGGSITAGAGASKSAETSYRALTTKWFRDTFPKAKITEVNAAIGGTGSDLGTFRCRKDLLDRHPDLDFIEFAVNDGAGNPSRVQASMEGIVRQIWRDNPSADIVFLYTTAKSLAAAYDRGETPPTIVVHEKVAAAYRIPSINIGKTLWQQVHDGQATWATLLPDNTHPGDTGYAIYAKQIGDFLEAHRNDKKERPHKKLRAPISPVPLENAHLIDAFEITAPSPDWIHDEPGEAKRFPHNISSNQSGAELKYRFKGTAIGVYWVIAPDSGDMEWSIDGSAPQRASSWDHYALRYSRANYKILDDSLPAGEHELILRVLPDKDPQSKGTWIRIGALMVN
jgi:lysophospholipase L1-like esterase